MGKLDGRNAVVTGAGRGIGRAVAMLLAEQGASVVVNDPGGNVDGTSHDNGPADQVVAEIKDAGGRAVANYDSVATAEGGEAMVRQCVDAFGRIDMLINVAGILRDRMIFNMSEEEWDAVYGVHLKGHFNTIKPASMLMRQQRYGRIVNFSSISGLRGISGQSNYGAAKAGIAGFSRVLALELAKYNARVNTISPGASTRMTIHLREARGVKVDVDAPDQSPAQVAPVVTWLASDAGQDVSAQIIDVMQGWVGIMQQPAVIQSFTSGGMWTLSDLDKVMPKLLEAKEKHDAEVKAKGVPEPL